MDSGASVWPHNATNYWDSGGSLEITMGKTEAVHGARNVRRQLVAASARVDV